MYPINLKHH
jgi:hypothetical protein